MESKLVVIELFCSKTNGKEISMKWNVKSASLFAYASNRVSGLAMRLCKEN